MLWDILRFYREAPRLAAEDDSTTVEEFLARDGYSRAFAEHYLLPMGSAVWSCPMGKFARFPLRFIVEFYQNHGLLRVFGQPTWRVVEGGSQTYVRAIFRGFRDRIRLNTPVQRVRRTEVFVEVFPRGGTAERFDHVVFACHSDQALRILGEQATATEREILAAFPYERNVAVLHTDASLLPHCRAAWASWNYRLRDDDHAAPACVTYNMNMLQGIRTRAPLCVTLNAEERIAPERVLRRFEYHHPVFSTRRAAAQARHAELLGPNRSSFCGAYWRNGFHEDGVVSALAAVKAMGAQRYNRGRGTAPAAFGTLATGVAE